MTSWGLKHLGQGKRTPLTPEEEGHQAATQRWCRAHQLMFHHHIITMSWNVRPVCPDSASTRLSFLFVCQSDLEENKYLES